MKVRPQTLVGEPSPRFVKRSPVATGYGRGARAVGLGCVLWLVACQTVWGQDKATEQDAPRKEARTKFIKSEFAKWTFTLAPPGERSVSSDPVPAAGIDPALRYTNPVGSLVQDGATCFFRREGVPVAAWSISIRGPEAPSKVWVEMTSLVGDPARCDKEGNVLWSPARGGHIGKKLAGAETPSDKPVRRLVQMRDIARRFTAELYKGQDPNPTLLRLMPQPMDRYRHDRSGVVDGALFAFVEANDPEFLLVVEAVRAGDGDAGWRYSLARMTSRRVRVVKDGQTEFEVENFWQGPRSPADPYLEMQDGTLDESASSVAK